MSDKAPEDRDGKPTRPDPKSNDPKPADKPLIPKINQKDAVNMAAASQFAYTLVGATLILGWCGHWLGVHLLGGRPWDALLMLLFGALGFGAEMYRMLNMFNVFGTKKDESKKDNNGKDDTKKDS